MDDKMGRAQSHRQGGPRLICLVAQNRPGAFRYPIDVIGGPNGDFEAPPPNGRQTAHRDRTDRTVFETRPIAAHIEI